MPETDNGQRTTDNRQLSYLHGMFLLADKITHLTAARYFAARGAEWLFFDPSSISIPEIQAIRGWVEGPRAGLYLPLGSMSMDEDILAQIQPDGLMLGHFADRKNLINSMPFFKEWRPERGDDPGILVEWMAAWPEAEAQLIRLEEWSTEEIMALLASVPEDLQLVISTTPEAFQQGVDMVSHAAGICLIAPPEEEVGLVSFETIDEAIDALEAYLF